jgi:hypothetical protein
MEPVQLAAILAGAVLLASMISVKVGVSVALVELTLGVVLGNAFKLNPEQRWLLFIAGFASVVLIGDRPHGDRATMVQPRRRRRAHHRCAPAAPTRRDRPATRRRADLSYTATTENTGGSRVATVDHVAPASPEANTSPEVAPK